MHGLSCELGRVTNLGKVMNRKPYSEYKPSGVEWLGDVPEHWAVKQARRCLVEHKQGYYTTDTYVDDGLKLLRITDLSGNGFVKTDDCPSVDIKDDAVPFLLRDNDFVFARTGGAGSFGLVRNLKEKTVFASYLIRFRFSKKTYADFLRYSFLSKPFVQGIIRNIHGGVNQNVHAEDIKDQFIPLPPLPEQQAIANFLDRETGRIDTLISKKKKFIDLLKEKRTALISRAVTKGLNPKVKIKPSGVEWLGDVPEHWKVLPLKRIVEIPVTDGPHETPEILDEGIPFVSAEAIRQNKIDFDRKRGFISINDHLQYSQKYKPKRDDIFMIKSGATTGNLAIVETDEEFNIWSPLAVVRVNQKRANARFILSAMNSKEFQTSVQLFWCFGTQQNIGMNVIENLVVSLPPLPEQQAIAAYLDLEAGKIDTLMAKVDAAIEKLKEYRTALISAAVTGKIDVREVA
jgi:type I restriction enzyme, S subunit